MIEHVLPVFKQYDSKCAAQLIEVLHSGGKLAVPDSLIERVAQIQDLMHAKGQQIEHKENKG